MSQRNWRPLTLARRAKTSILHSFCLSFNMPSLSPSLVPGPAPALRAATILFMGWGATERPLTQLLGWSGQAFWRRWQPTVLKENEAAWALSRAGLS